MNKFQINFKLKQHTPMIHFQHEQAGATLRATELKPKLDRLLLSELGKGDINEGRKKAEKEGWLVGRGDHPALDYKVKIKAIREVANFSKLIEVQKFDYNSQKQKWMNQGNFPHLLANMGGKDTQDELKNFSFFSEINLDIICFHSTELLSSLKTSLPKLFEKENFGNRQSKGFGSFSVIEVNSKPYSSTMSFPYRFDWEVGGRNESERQKNLFEAIDFLYKTIRSGINFGRFDKNRKEFIPQFYFKSILRDYAENKLGEQWDKKTIKEHYFFGNKTKGTTTHRDLLGFSTEESWGKTYRNATITKSSSTVERFTSPIKFKPIHVKNNLYQVWIGIDEIPENFRKAKIKVKKNGQGNLILAPSQKLKLTNYLKYAFEQIDLRQHVNQYDTKNLNSVNHWIFKKKIEPIYQSIKHNLKNNNK